jgi:membrane protein DedA with SNARE-associated domain
MFEPLVASIDSYLGLFLASAVTGLIVPVPEDLVMLWAGLRIDAGTLNWLPAIGAAAAGTLLRDIATYWLGRLFGAVVIEHPAVETVIGRRRLERARQALQDHGDRAVILGRFLIGMRVPVFFIAGSMRTRFRTFLFWDAIGLIVSTPILIWLGYQFGDPFLEGVRWLLQRTSFVVGTLVAVAAIFLIRSRLRDRRPATAPGEHVPDSSGDQ